MENQEKISRDLENLARIVNVGCLRSQMKDMDLV